MAPLCARLSSDSITSANWYYMRTRSRLISASAKFKYKSNQYVDSWCHLKNGRRLGGKPSSRLTTRRDMPLLSYPFHFVNSIFKVWSTRWNARLTGPRSDEWAKATTVLMSRRTGSLRCTWSKNLSLLLEKQSQMSALIARQKRSVANRKKIEVLVLLFSYFEDELLPKRES